MFWNMIYIFCILLILFEVQHRWKYRNLNRFPGPMVLPFVGAIHCFFYFKSTMRTLSYLSSINSITKFPLGHEMMLVISDPDMFEFFLRSPKFVNKPEQYHYLAPWLGRNGLFVADRTGWFKLRKLYSCAFHLNHLEKYTKIISRHSDVFVSVIRNAAMSGPVDMYPIVVNYTLDVITEIGLGLKTNYQRNCNKEYVHGLHILGNILMNRTLSLWKRFDFLYKMSPDYKAEQKYLKIVSDVHRKAIENGRKMLSDNIFVDILLNSTIDEKPFSDELIITEMNSLIFGGYDTVSTAISTIIYALASYKDVQDKVVKELKNIFGDDRDKPASIQDLGKMIYLELVIKEAMRLYSVVPFIARKMKEDVEFKGTVIPEGTILMFYMHGVHRSSTYDRPEEFIPERFLPTNYIKPYSFVPFSAGPRSCLGQKFAMLEMKETFSKLLRHLEFEPAGPDYNMKLEAHITMKPVSGVYVKIKPRVF